MSITSNTQPENNIDRASDINHEGIDLSSYLELLIDDKYLIAGLTTIFLFFSIIYAELSTPIYSADALLQVSEKAASLPVMEDLAVLMGSGQSSSIVEMEIIKSRKVLGDVVDKFNWTVSVQPRYFPVIGRYMERKFRHHKANEPDALAEPFLGLSKYSWGGEIIKAGRFDVPGKYIGAPFILRVKGEGKYEVLSTNNVFILEGEVGKLEEDKNGLFKLYMTELHARPGTEFYLIKQDRNRVINSVRSQILITEKVRGSGLLQVAMYGGNPNDITDTVNELAQSYLRLNVERHSEESKKMLDFISSQLPQLKADLDASEHAYNIYRENKGAIDIGTEISGLLQRSAKIEIEISSLRLERAELTQRLTEEHPLLHRIDEKIILLQQQKKELEAKLSVLPETELQTVKLSRDVTVANELYTLLLNKAQELKISKAGVLGNVRIINSAVTPESPVRPDKVKITLAGTALGLFIGILISVVRAMMNKTVCDPSVIERYLNLPVYAEIPFSKHQSLSDKNNKKKKYNRIELLADTNNDSQLVESMRSLRTSIQFALMETKGNIITISGPSPETGKSFVSANFSYVMAEAGKKVLLVDADLRRGHLYKYFYIDKLPGLSEVISNNESFENVLRHDILIDGLDVITTGEYPPNPSELLLGEGFAAFLETARKKYDLVVIDTPPILSVTDAAIVGRYASANFMLIRSGRHYLREIEDANRRFERNGVSIKGVIFNGVEYGKHGYGYTYGYKYKTYNYSYK